MLHIDNQDLKWLGGLPFEAEGMFDEPSELKMPNGRELRISKRWSYDSSTQTAAMLARYEELNAAGEVMASAVRGPVRLNCFFRCEVEHLLQRARFEVRALYGDFARAELTEESSEMIWIAGRR